LNLLLLDINLILQKQKIDRGFEPPDETCYGAGDDFVPGKGTYIHWVLSGGGKSQILHRQSGRLPPLIKNLKMKCMYKKSILLVIGLVTVTLLPCYVDAQAKPAHGAAIGVAASGDAAAGVAASGAYSFSVEKTGRGPALILIPGLYCSGDVWKETVAHYKDRYTCYSITLPGFAGQPPLHSGAAAGNAGSGTAVAGDKAAVAGGSDTTLLAAMGQDIARFIVQNKLQKPLVVGHSLGGWLALKIAVTNPGLLGGVICVSSAPFLPALSMGGISIDSARAIGTMIKGYMVGQSPEQIRQGQVYVLPTMIRDTARIHEVMDMAVRCDPATQGEVMYELFSIDLRPEMYKLQCPVLVLGDWISYKSYGATRENVIEKYQQQFGKAAHVTIEINDSSKHFIMYDEPAWFFGAMDKFLASK
jgi:N-formylmaleamate deformylase